MANSKADRIRLLNDSFRRTGLGGAIVMSSGVDAQTAEAKQQIVSAVQEYADFSAGNDPYAEHDFGSFQIGGEKLFWKIDYYGRDMKSGSPDPSDPNLTSRVLTIMLASEY